MKSQQSVKDVMEAAGNLLRIGQKIAEAVAMKLGDASALYSLATDPGKVLVDRIADVIANGALVASAYPEVLIGGESYSWPTVFKHCLGLEGVNILGSAYGRRLRSARDVLHAPHAGKMLVPLLVTRHVTFAEASLFCQKLGLRWASTEDVLVAALCEMSHAFSESVSTFWGQKLVLADASLPMSETVSNVLSVHTKGLTLTDIVWVDDEPRDGFFPGVVLAAVRV
ncbi:MAG: hypothetical protein WCJ29_03865 [bacterium]